MRPLILALSAMGVAQGALAGGLDSAHLRGSAVYEPASSSYVVPTGLETPLPQRPVFVPAIAEPANNAIEIEVGARYMFSRARMAKDLLDDPRFSANLNSRLTYSGLTSHSGELFGRADTGMGFFLKGYAGLGALTKGNLQDEDFPPALDPYSSTTSDQSHGRLSYGTVDVGYNILHTPVYRFGGFVGYQYLSEKVNGYGCVQQATNPFICVPAISDGVLVITEDAKWHSFRVGVAGDVMLTDRLKLAAEAAWVPYALVKAKDSHWLRIGTDLFDFAGPIPQTGTGSGVQIEGTLSYQVTDQLSFGVGARWWHMKTNGTADLEQTLVGFPPELAVSQPLNFKIDRYGVFAQGSYRFGAM